MRGGVSLAVWMGGACAEIEALRRARPTEEQEPLDRKPADAVWVGPAVAAGEFWGPLLEVAHFNQVQVDVLAGTSAGGLNSVLLATSLKYGVEFGAYRELWLELADLRQLLRGTNERDPQSLLRGDEHFLKTLTTALREQLSDRSPNNSYLDVSLTATVLDPMGVQSIDDLGTPVLEPSHRANFRFRSNYGTTDFVKAAVSSAEAVSKQQSELNSGIAEKLALASRSTSSFPGAFEPALIKIQRPADVDQSAQLGKRSGPEQGATNLFGQFSDARRTEYRVIDGGVLDNIPVGRAIHAVAGSPASSATHRYLLYLDPSPRTAGYAEKAETDFIATLSGASGARGTAESVLDDLAELRRHNDMAQRYRAMQRMISATLPPQLTLSEEVIAAANEQRATLTARRIRALLEDPVSALGEDPFVDTLQTTPLLASRGRGAPNAQTPFAMRLSQDELDGFEEELRIRLKERLPATLGKPREAAALLGPQTLTRTALALLEVAHDDELRGTERGIFKKRLYDVHVTASLLAHIAELFWPVHASSSPPPGKDGWTSWIMAALHEQHELLQQMGELTPEPQDKWASYKWLYKEVVRCRGLSQRLVNPRNALQALLWDELVAVGRMLGKEAVSDSAAPLRPKLEAVASSRFSSPKVGRVLIAYEMATQPLQTISPRPPLPMNFMRVSSAQRSPAADGFFGSRLTQESKLAGNDVMNFAAFYKRSWRANDWMWGRLDAAAALVSLLLRPGIMREHWGSADIETLLGHFKAAVTTIGNGSPFMDQHIDTDAWAKELERLWASNLVGIRKELTELLGPRGSTQRLDKLLATLMERRQLELLCGELPSVIRAAAADQLGVANAALAEATRRESLIVPTTLSGVNAEQHVATPGKLRSLCRNDYRVGSERLKDDIGRADFTELMAHLLVVAWKAVRASVQIPAFLRPVGIALNAIRAAAVGVVRAPRWALVGLPLGVVLFLWVAIDGRSVFGVLDRTTAIAALVGIFITVGLPVMQSSRLRLVATVAMLAAGGTLGLHLWERQGLLAEEFRGVNLFEGKEIVPVEALWWSAAGITGGAAALAAYRGMALLSARRRLGLSEARNSNETPSHLGTPLFIAATTGVLLLLSWRSDAVKSWINNLAFEAVLVASLVAVVTASLAVSVALYVAWRLHRSTYVSVLVGTFMFVAVMRWPLKLPELATLVAVAIASIVLPVLQSRRQPQR